MLGRWGKWVKTLRSINYKLSLYDRLPAVKSSLYSLFHAIVVLSQKHLLRFQSINVIGELTYRLRRYYCGARQQKNRWKIRIRCENRDKKSAKALAELTRFNNLRLVLDVLARGWITRPSSKALRYLNSKHTSRGIWKVSQQLGLVGVYSYRPIDSGWT